MRLQTGLVPSGRFNPLCDIVDVDEHLTALGEDFPGKLSRHLNDVFHQYGLKKKPRDKVLDLLPPLALKSVVINNIYTGDEGLTGG
ncbi:MAG TPA: hypothetical protein DD640_06235, partial [Clostridiales bacterium]|nr:hypothetical protein [Clostridiales bacterium]